MKDGPLLRTEYKTTPKWAWSGPELGHCQLSMASDLDVELEPFEEVVGNLDFSTPVKKQINFSVSDLNNFLPRTHQSNRSYLPLCYYLSEARSRGFSCSNSSSAMDTR